MVLKPEKTYQTLTRISGPLLFIEATKDVAFGELVEIELPNGEVRRGQVLEVSEDKAIIQVFEGTSGLDIDKTLVKFAGETIKIPVAQEMIGRIFDGSARPIDGGPSIIPEDEIDIHGSPLNPYAREYPKEPIQTGISAIDGMNTLVRGQKLPIFTGTGLPHNQLVAQIIRQAKVPGKEEEFLVIFAALGITADEARFFKEEAEKRGALTRTIMVLNLADDPAIERIITPRIALTIAEYLAYTYDMHILVILSDMTNYCEALREISAAREEVPGRRGYPGYMYTDLATIYERAGRIHGRKGTITQMPVVTMPHDDITHPIPDLTGYVTEGQIFLDRGLHRKGIYPPIDVFPSLSRLMKEGIGKGLTREDHREVSDCLYYGYAEGRRVRELIAVIGEEALSELDRLYLHFADEFERRFINQGYYEDRSFEETLDLGWELLSMLPESELKRADPATICKYLPKYRKREAITEPNISA